MLLLLQRVTDTDDVCPSCGAFATLNPTTGFCAKCSKGHCYRCGDPSTTSLCQSCRRIRWLEVNAESIEDHLLGGLTLKQAIEEVADAIRPTCIICGKPIHRGTNGRHFICTSTPECRRARRRYKYLIYDKGYSKESAIEMITNGRQDD